MRSHAAFSIALTFALSAFACAASTSSDDPGLQGGADQGSEQDITQARSELSGSWVLTDEQNLTSSVAYELRPNGEFWRDDNKIFNGVLVKGAPQPVQRTTGHYAIDTNKKTIAFTVETPAQYKGVVETYNYTFEAGRVLNGVFLPGKAPDTRAHLTIVGIAAPGSKIAYPAIKYAREDSWCTSNADCDDERADGTWKPMSVPPGGGIGPYVPPNDTCDTTARTCSATLDNKN